MHISKKFRPMSPTGIHLRTRKHHLLALVMDQANATAGWQPNPDRRGTLGILESCLFTIFACTWSIQHLNLPSSGDTQLTRVLRKCKWAFLTALFPEFIMAHAILEFALAIDVMILLDRQHLLRRPWWFSIFAEPRSNTEDGPSGDAESGPQTISRDDPWTITHCYFANMGGLYLDQAPENDSEATSASSASAQSSSESANAAVSSTRQHLLTGHHVAHHWNHLLIPRLSVDFIKDKSKTDYFTKFIAILQIAQLVLSAIVRKVRHLAFSQLEIVTLALAVCGFITYICYWYKPQDVSVPCPVQLRRNRALPRELTLPTFDRLWKTLMNVEAIREGQILGRVPNDNIPRAALGTTHWAFYIMTGLSVAFGSLHLVAWNFEFPTYAEQILWRVASLLSTALPPVALLAIPISQITKPWGDQREFMRTCIRVMREYCWHHELEGSRQVLEASDKLELIYSEYGVDGALGLHYREIFKPEPFINRSRDVGLCIRSFIEDHEGNLREKIGLSEDFPKQFRQLLGIIKQDVTTKKLADAGHTDIYPIRPRFTKLVNWVIIYSTSIGYLLARLTVMAVALSSLRRMPDSVYVTSWTRNIPAIQ